VHHEREPVRQRGGDRRSQPPSRAPGRARAEILGEQATAEQIGEYMESATVCIDEIDKISAIVGGKPYVTGHQHPTGLLTLIEGERILYPVTVYRNKQLEKAAIPRGHRRRCCSCAPGAFEQLYDQVYRRVTSPTSRVKLPAETVYENGEVQIREYFTLRHWFKQEDLFDYGMQPQFLSRFDNSIILEDLNAGTLSRIFTEPSDSVFRASQNFFKNYGIDVEVTEGAVRKIADEASKSSRIGAPRAQGGVGEDHQALRVRPVRPAGRVKKEGDRHRLLVDEGIVTRASTAALGAASV
jgi:ATP-dependent Clp protease ATP-binding subunit ClpX